MTLFKVEQQICGYSCSTPYPYSLCQGNYPLEGWKPCIIKNTVSLLALSECARVMHTMSSSLPLHRTITILSLRDTEQGVYDYSTGMAVFVNWNSALVVSLGCHVGKVDTAILASSPFQPPGQDAWGSPRTAPPTSGEVQFPVVKTSQLSHCPYRLDQRARIWGAGTKPSVSLGNDQGGLINCCQMNQGITFALQIADK
jgi:hypothetical protein